LCDPDPEASSVFLDFSDHMIEAAQQNYIWVMGACGPGKRV
jgi:hypothetical protein